MTFTTPIFFPIKQLLPFLALLTFSNYTLAKMENNPLLKETPHGIYHVLSKKTLAEATQQIAQRSGIKFSINAANQHDFISRKLAADDWKSAISQMLQGYNYSTILENGAIKTVIVTGVNGSGHCFEDFVQYQQNPLSNLPAPYSNFKPGSVMPLKLPLAAMRATPVGGKLMLDLPIGQYRVNHDSMIRHEDGSSTWIGYLDAEGKGYRFYLSEGESGLMGNLYTPDGVYNIETVDGETVLVDPESAGLQGAGYEGDQAEPTNNPGGFFNSFILPDGDDQTTAAATISTGASAGLLPKAKYLNNFSGPVVDLMVLYTTKRQTDTYARQQIAFSVDKSNQAFIDSRINLRLRLVHTRSTNYTENNNNGQALFDLSHDQGAFRGTKALRNQYGADLVMLYRPLYAQTSGNCGTTYVGFANGSNFFNPESGYGTINNGYSKDNLKNRYCDASTFTHEVGHLFGNVHDRDKSSFQGKFPYSYAWGKEGLFGTIMSYRTPVLMLFSSPLLKTQCKGQPCGYPAQDTARSSDQTRTFNATAATVARYKKKKVAVPSLR